MKSITLVAAAALLCAPCAWSAVIGDVDGVPVEDSYSVDDAKRLQLVLVKDIPGSTISRYFIADFQAVATEAEFKQLINEIGVLGKIYSKIRQVNKGDVINIDWTPGKGVHSTINGKPLMVSGNVTPYLNNELLYRVMLRMYLKASGSAEMRDNLLGRSRSMLNTASAAVNPPRTP